ncbi:MAG: bifunctional phosphoribosyl-AMP cyclohydrolase/phosphoribosyl-ATP diphosphatase HisIE [Firmicutes bacterium]|nr:bifunctional phosphoribosyl-AMP cyclohydrolase/phosphoribosyl-ATP diphosphatase HisIE [Bacillota bacterium]
MIDISEIRFDANGLVPAVVVDKFSRQVLMLAYMNRQSLEKTMDTGLVTFWSRSRQELWTKGETSGNYLHAVSVTADCDRDSLLVVAEPDGPACHLGTKSCFDYPLWNSGKLDDFTAEGLYTLLEGRKRDMPQQSYTTYLFEKGLDKILKKVGEECTEVIIAAKDNDKAETVYEVADLAYHVMVMMVQQGISLEDITKELASRHVIDRKVKQEKMASDKDAEKAEK